MLKIQPRRLYLSMKVYFRNSNSAMQSGNHWLAFSRPCHTFSISVWCLTLSQHSWGVLVKIITPTEFTCQLNLCNCAQIKQWKYLEEVLQASSADSFVKTLLAWTFTIEQTDIYEMGTVFVTDTENPQTAYLNMDGSSNRPTGLRPGSISSLKSQCFTKRRKMFIKRCKMIPGRQKPRSKILKGLTKWPQTVQTWPKRVTWRPKIDIKLFQWVTK